MKWFVILILKRSWNIFEDISPAKKQWLVLIKVSNSILLPNSKNQNWGGWKEIKIQMLMWLRLDQLFSVFWAHRSSVFWVPFFFYLFFFLVFEIIIYLHVALSFDPIYPFPYPFKFKSSFFTNFIAWKYTYIHIYSWI